MKVKDDMRAGFNRKQTTVKRTIRVLILMTAVMVTAWGMLLCYIKRRCNLFFREQESMITNGWINPNY